MLCRALLFSALTSSLGFAAEERGLPPIQLKWQAPAPCGDTASVLAEVQTMLDQTAPEGDRQRIEAEVTVSRTNSGELQIQLNTGAKGTTRSRTLLVANCTEATHATALLLALLVSPRTGTANRADADADRGNADRGNANPASTDEANTDRASGKPKDAARSEPPSADSRPPPARTDSTPNADTSLRSRFAGGSAQRAHTSKHWLLGASGVVDHGSLPNLGVGAALRLGVGIDPLWVELRPALWAPSRESSRANAAAGGEFRLYDVGLLGCYRYPLMRSVSTDGCLGAQATLLRAQGYGALEPAAVSGSYFSVVAELGLGLEISDTWSWRLGAALSCSPERPSFAIRNLGALHQPALWVERFSAGIQRSF